MDHEERVFEVTLICLIGVTIQCALMAAERAAGDLGVIWIAAFAAAATCCGAWCGWGL